MNIIQKAQQFIKTSIKSAPRLDVDGYTNNFDTHRPILKQAVQLLKNSKSNLTIVECGTGMGSTKYLLDLLKPGGGTLISNENNPDWLLKMQSILPSSEKHKWNNVGDSWYHFLKKFALTIDNIDILFIDSAPWDSRSIALDLLGPKSKIVVVHDVDYFPTNNIWGYSQAPLISRDNIGSRDYSDIFTYWSEVFPNDFKDRTGPPTLIGSNFIKDVESLSFEGCFINSSSSFNK